MPKQNYRRLPNGFGSITKLSGKRRAPWNARTPVLGYNSNFSPITKSLGCFETWAEAYDCIKKWHEINDDPRKWEKNITFERCYKKAVNEKFESETLSEKSRYTYSTPFNSLTVLHKRKMAELRLDDLQDAIDGLKTGYGSKTVALTMLHLVFEYALKRDYIEKDYSQFVKVRAKKPETPPDKFFEWEELARIKRDAENGDETAKMIIVMCYTGFRASAYKDLVVEDGCFIGGVKNEQSRNRRVPIYPQIEKWANITFPEYKFLLIEFRKYISKTLEREITPHATRHTFKWLCDSAKVDENTCRLLMGHKLKGDVHNRIYTHKSLEELRGAISTLPW